ncbi:hypothetical protein F4821DRAFT_247700 [Hypoxylon rubiginosum]|uniref:Uncharacterized protein n=1 Tax=Hypoxylon rubiginosum TaxID=110542 RepID=A0ACC0CPG5_9PEZI|nr:hypothetical protein F4821DRAFT_247700 [Hypoxylon rubiginosum]
MEVRCSDVPLLMQEGFHWSTANVIREEGFINDISPDLRHLKLRYLGNPNHPCTTTRYWFLRDLQQPPRWTARLQVHAPNYEILSGIRLENWTIDMVRIALAYDCSGKLIYQFNTSKPRSHFNAIYDDMPLLGWWPWPKENPLATTKAIIFNFIKCRRYRNSR